MSTISHHQCWQGYQKVNPCCQINSNKASNSCNTALASDIQRGTSKTTCTELTPIKFYIHNFCQMKKKKTAPDLKYSFENIPELDRGQLGTGSLWGALLNVAR